MSVFIFRCQIKPVALLGGLTHSDQLTQIRLFYTSLQSFFSLLFISAASGGAAKDDRNKDKKALMSHMDFFLLMSDILILTNS